jgi:hypothetical protein
VHKVLPTKYHPDPFRWVEGPESGWVLAAVEYVVTQEKHGAVPTLVRVRVVSAA